MDASLGRDPAMRWIVGSKAIERQAASTSQMGRFETYLLASDDNFAALTVSAAAVARRYDLNANLLFNWKRRYEVSDRFLPVEISEPGPPAPRASDGQATGRSLGS